MEVVRILGHEPFEERREDIPAGDAADDMWVEILDLLAVALVQDLEAIAFVDVRLRALAGRKRKQEKRRRAPRKMD